MNMIKTISLVSISAVVPSIAFAHAGHLDTIEHAVLHMLEHNGKELGALMLVILVMLVGRYVTNSKKNKAASIKRDAK